MAKGARKAKLGVMLADTVEVLAGFAYLQVWRGEGTGAEVWTLLGDGDYEVIAPTPRHPPLPTIDRRIRDLARAGWGTLSHTFFYGLIRTGMRPLAARDALVERLREGRLVWRDGRWQCWAA
jgi:hypothetical protein